MSDIKSLSAFSLLGLLTELNAYTHGLNFERKINFTIPTTLILNNETVLNPMKEFHEVGGVFYHLSMLELYLNELQKDPKAWKNFFIKNNRIILEKLLRSVLDVLKKSNHCEAAKNQDTAKYWLTIYRKFSSEKSVILDIIGTSDFLELKCESIEEKLNEQKKCD